MRTIFLFSARRWRQQKNSWAPRGGQESSVHSRTVQANSIAFILSRAFYHGVRFRNPSLTGTPAARYRICMTQSILVFDFGSNEDAAQQARQKLEGWKQTLHLGEKIRLKFDRKGSVADSGKDGGLPSTEAASGEGAAREEKSAAKKAPAKAAKEPAGAGIQLLVRLDFSGHEKLSHNRWLARIPSEEPFKSAKSEIIHHSDPAFASVTERFDSLG
jgi:hypothetical protein